MFENISTYIKSHPSKTLRSVEKVFKKKFFFLWIRTSPYTLIFDRPAISYASPWQFKIGFQISNFDFYYFEKIYFCCERIYFENVYFCFLCFYFEVGGSHIPHSATAGRLGRVLHPPSLVAKLGDKRATYIPRKFQKESLPLGILISNGPFHPVLTFSNSYLQASRS